MAHSRFEMETMTIDKSEADDLTDDSIDLTNRKIVGIYMPAAWTAADITFVGATTSTGTFQAVVDSDGTTVTVSAAASKFVVLTQAERDVLAAVPFLKIATSSGQAGDRSLVVVTERTDGFSYAA